MRHTCVRLGAPGAMARSPPLLYEVYLHAEHEEEERGFHRKKRAPKRAASASTDGFVVESAERHGGTGCVSRDAPRAVRGVWRCAPRARR